MAERLTGHSPTMDECVKDIRRIWQRFYGKELGTEERVKFLDNYLDGLPPSVFEKLMDNVGPRGETRLAMIAGEEQAVARKNVAVASERRPPKGLRIHRRRQLAEERRRGDGRP